MNDSSKKYVIEEKRYPIDEVCSGADAVKKEYIVATTEGGSRTKYSTIHKAARQMTLQQGLRKKSKEDCVSMAILTLLNIQKALETGESYRGCTWTKEYE